MNLEEGLKTLLESPGRLRTQIILALYNKGVVGEQEIEENYPEVAPLIRYDKDHEYAGWEIELLPLQQKLNLYPKIYYCRIDIETGSLTGNPYCFNYWDNQPNPIKTPLFYFEDIPKKIRDLGDLAIDYWIYTQYSTSKPLVTPYNSYFEATMSNIEDFTVAYGQTQEEAWEAAYDSIKLICCLMKEFYFKKWKIDFDHDGFLFPESDFTFTKSSELKETKTLFFWPGYGVSHLITGTNEKYVYDPDNLFEFGTYKRNKFVKLRKDRYGCRYFLGKDIQGNEEVIKNTLDRLVRSYIYAGSS